MENAARTLFVTDPNQKMDRFPWIKSKLPRILFIILAVVIAVEIVLAGKNLLSQSPAVTKPEAIGSTVGAQIKLLSDKTSYKVGDKVPVSVNVFTGGEISSGTDVLIKYNPTFLSASSSSITKGSIYPDYPVVEVDSSNGMIRISGISSVGGKGFIGNGDLATINFTAKAKGFADVNVEFTPSLTNDSNITRTTDNEDILKQVFGLEVTIN